MDDKIKWCKEKGMKLIDSNNNLAEEYYQNAEETLRVMNKIKDTGSNMWLATQKYYTEYFAAYSLLMKIGIKSEIHSCTIEVIKLLESEKIINFNFSCRLEEDKELRIDNQYYLKNRPVNIESKSLSDLLLNIRNLLDNITKGQINQIREKIK
ncbi:hypothetical protein CMO93_04075 [Candidatus Woesearchaeota archaeon]|jgi:uncharacterized protein (UPF0332 family)|nr:hypothetical protein [Candidatus Woesearchaeota archaeon]|tara:strand:- start:2061 stop:2519 length:459 start_codon:yes stop_codon:yes gene_type:complete